MSNTVPPKRDTVAPVPVVDTRPKKPFSIESCPITAWLVIWVVPIFIQRSNAPTNSTLPFESTSTGRERGRRVVGRIVGSPVRNQGPVLLSGSGDRGQQHPRGGIVGRIGSAYVAAPLRIDAQSVRAQVAVGRGGGPGDAGLEDHLPSLPESLVTSALASQVEGIKVVVVGS